MFSNSRNIIPTCISIIEHDQWRRTNFKVGGHTAAEIFLSFRFTFVAVQVQLVALVSVFVMVSTVWSVSCFLFFYSR